MGKSINPMFILKIQGEAGSGSALRSFIVLMSLRPAIPWQVALLHCLPPLHWPVSIFEPSVTICQPSLKEAGKYLLDLKGRPRQNINIRWGQFR
jgi:hypothetical protein